jgi:ABC-type multidrug transport system, ATPase and permease components
MVMREPGKMRREQTHLSKAELRKSLGKGSTVWRLFRFIFSNYRIGLAVVAACIVVSSLTSLASSLFTKTLIDDFIEPMAAVHSSDYAPLAKELLRLGAVLLAGVAASYSYNLIMIFVGQGTMLKLRESVFKHLEELPLKYFDSHTHGEIMSVFTNDVDTLRQVIGSTMPNLLQSLITIAATFTSMVVLSLPLTLVSLLMAFLTVLVTTKLGKIAKGHFVERQKNLGIVNGFIEEMVSGQRVVKVYCHEEKAMEEFSVINEMLRSSVCKANRISNIIMPVNHNIGNLGYVFIAIIGAIVALGGFDSWWLCGLNGTALTLGTLVAFLTLHKNFTRPISSISSEINSIAMASAGTDRVYSVLDEAKEPCNGNVTLINISVSDNENLQVSEKRTGKWAWKVGNELKPLEGLVSLSDVDFSYVPGKQVLFDISLTAYPGQKIAFVGGTGAGKTTITNLVNRFYEIQDGCITYDGIDIRDIEMDSLRRSLGIVLQETKLFSASVMENIRYGRLDATDEECVAAARLVCADSFIRRLSKGYDTILAADGGNLSQGERQLIAIARAAVANAPVLILDEATSSIDTRTERLIQKGMDELMKGRTTFVIAHRLSTVQNANYIMVMDHGRIIERGRHDELLAQKGKYYELFTGNQITS